MKEILTTEVPSNPYYSVILWFCIGEFSLKCEFRLGIMAFFLRCVLSVENYFFCIWKGIKAGFLASALTAWIFNSLAVLKWICSCVTCLCGHKDDFPFGSALRLSHLMWFVRMQWTHAWWAPAAGVTPDLIHSWYAGCWSWPSSYWLDCLLLIDAD